jgi:hypothetical protein
MQDGGSLWWVASGLDQDLKATAKYLKAQGADLIVLVDAESTEAWEVLPGGAAESRLRSTLRRIWGVSPLDFSPSWRLVVETENRRGVVTCYVHLWLYAEHPFSGPFIDKE